jgi:thioredoxin-like negative regulator of GroEL
MKKLLLALLFLPFISFSQSIPGEGLIVVEFNAPFSNSKCEYLGDLEDCDVVKIDISKNTKLQGKHKIASVPTLIIFYDGEEKGRFQANIMMELEATKEEVQEKIEEIIMEDF